MSITAYELMATLGLDKTNYENGLNEAEGYATQKGSKIGGIFSAVGKATVAGLAVSTAAVGALVKASVSEYANYEQLVGGVSKLYGTAGMSIEDYAKSVGKSTEDIKGKYDELTKAQDLVMTNAQNAYKTAGMSTAQYMETATSFSASLINSLGGDTVKAAEQTDVAMRAISDNFNTFGGDIQMIQGAFQGFAKQNYTMLDNLKLGYGGTQAEMERLIADANEYAAANGQAADLSIDSFSDIVTAIELVQEKQGIAGTTAREASTTIEGSLNMVKGAWENLVAGFADPNADIGVLIGNVVEAVVGSTDEAGNHINGFLDNIIPAILRAVEGIGTAIGSMGPIIGTYLPQVISDVLPSLLSAATQLFVSLISALPGLFQSLFEASKTIMSEFIDQLPEMWEQISTALGDLFTMLMEGIPELINEIIPILEDLGTAVAENLPSIFENILPKILEFAKMLNENAGTFIDAGINLILNLAQGLIDSLPTLISYVPQIITTILNILNENAPKILLMGAQLILMLAEGLIQSIPAIIENIGNIVQMIIAIISAINWLNLGKEIITFIANGIKSLASQAPNIMKSIFEKAVEFIKNISWDATGKTVIAYLVGGIKGVGSMIANGLKQLFIDGVNAIKGIDWLGVGKNIIQGIVNGIKALGSQIKEVLLGLASSAFEGVKDFFGIHSPSRKMRDEIGKYIPEGMALGIKDHADDVIKAMDDLEQIPERYDPSIDFGGDSDYPNDRSGNNGGGNNGGNTYIINVNQQVSTPDEMAQAIRVESQYGLIEGVPI